jgi:hypothetical protein
MDLNIINQSPKWLFRKVQVDKDELIIIQNNLKNFVYKTIGSTLKIPTSFIPSFFFIEPSVIENYSPAYASLLKKLNLYDRWVQSGLSFTLKKFNRKKSGVHIDHYDTNIRCFSFNIPLLNCHDSYTVFYRSKTECLGKRFNIHQMYRWEDHKNSLSIENEDTLEEIARHSANDCAFINVSVPHQSVTDHDEFRVVLTSRFSPELHDYFED